MLIAISTTKDENSAGALSPALPGRGQSPYLCLLRFFAKAQNDIEPSAFYIRRDDFDRAVELVTAIIEKLDKKTVAGLTSW